MPPEPYSLEELATVLHAYGLSSRPNTTLPLNKHIYFRRLTTRNNVGQVFEEESKDYFQIAAKPASERRVAFIFESHGYPMAIVIYYQRLKFHRLQPGQFLKHSLTKSDPGNAYQSATIFALAPTKKSKAYLAGLLSTLSCPRVYYVLAEPNSILLAESIQLLLFDDVRCYHANRHQIISSNSIGMSAAHQLQCIKHFSKMLQQVDSDNKQEIIELLEILIKYQQLQTARGQMQQAPMGSMRLLIDQHMQKKIFAQSFATVDAISEALKDASYYPWLLRISHTLRFFGVAQLISELTAQKIKWRNEIKQRSVALRQAVPPSSILPQLAGVAIYCFNQSHACLSGRLAVFFVQQLHAWITFICDYYRSRQNYTSFGGFLMLLLLQQFQSWTAPESAAKLYQIMLWAGVAVGLWFMYSLGFMAFLMSSSLIFFAEHLYQTLKEERLDLTHASWSSKEALIPNFSTVLKIVLLLFSCMLSIIFDNGIYVQNMLLSLLTSTGLQLFFAELMQGIPFASAQQRNTFEFLFIQFCSLCIEEIGMRYIEREAIIAKYAPLPANREAKVAWDWWFFRKKFDLTHYNETHTCHMRCEITGVDIEEMSCTVQQELPWMHPVARL